MMGFTPVQVPASHVFVRVHASPSSQVVPFGFAGLEHTPVDESHVPASWHWSCAAQMTGFTRVQVPASHVSARVHASPSSHVLPFGFAGFEHTPVAGLHVPASWHSSCAAQTTGAPGTQLPLSHTSPTVHASSSVHVLPLALAGLEHAPVAGLHVPASWHWSCATHGTGFPAPQCPASHMSPTVHASPSSQAVPSSMSGLEQTPVDGSHVPAS